MLDDEDLDSGRWTPITGDEELTLGDRLHQDRGVRASCLDHFLGPETTLENLWRGQHCEEGDFVHGRYQVLKAETQAADCAEIHMAREGLVRQAGSKGVEDRLVQVTKRYLFHRVVPTVEVHYEVVNRYHSPVRSQFAVEFNFGLEGRVGDGVLIEPGDGRPLPVTKRGRLEGLDRVAITDITRGLKLVLTAEQPATLWFYPVECVVARRSGLETVYQGQCLLLGWPVSLWGEERVRFDLNLSVQLQR